MRVLPGSPGPPVRLVLDGTLCDGHGICSLRCPERIWLDEWGYAVVDEREIVDDRTAARARRAVAACPARALSCVAGTPGRDVPRDAPCSRRGQD